MSLFLVDILISTTYADDFSYSFMRAASFITLAVAISAGFVYYFYWRANCVRFFQFHYYLAWLVMVPALLFHLTGLNRLRSDDSRWSVRRSFRQSESTRRLLRVDHAIRALPLARRDPIPSPQVVAMSGCSP